MAAFSLLRYRLFPRDGANVTPSTWLDDTGKKITALSSVLSEHFVYKLKSCLKGSDHSKIAFNGSFKSVRLDQGTVLFTFTSQTSPTEYLLLTLN